MVEAGPSNPQEPDPREEEIRKLNIRTDSWSIREFLVLVKYTRDITLSLCYVLAAPVNLQFPDCRRFGPTVEPIFRGPTADIINIWRFTKSTTCILVGANVANTLIELFSFFKKFGLPTSEDLLWITMRAIDQPKSGPKPLAGVPKSLLLGYPLSPASRNLGCCPSKISFTLEHRQVVESEKEPGLPRLRS